MHVNTMLQPKTETNINWLRSGGRSPLSGEPGARFSKVPKLYGPFSRVTVPSVHQERRGFKSSNFRKTLNNNDHNQVS